MSYIIQKYSHSHTLLEHQAEHDNEQIPKCAVLRARQRPIPRRQHQHRLPWMLGLGWFVYKVTVWHVLSGSTAGWAPQGSSTWKWHYSVTGMGWLASFTLQKQHMYKNISIFPVCCTPDSLQNLSQNGGCPYSHLLFWQCILRQYLTYGISL